VCAFQTPCQVKITGRVWGLGQMGWGLVQMGIVQMGIVQMGLVQMGWGLVQMAKPI